MLTNKNIVIFLLFISIPFLEEFDTLIKYSAYDSNVNLTVSLFEKNYREDEVKGVQFDLLYDKESIALNELTSLVDGSTFEYASIGEGAARGVIFNLDGRSFTDLELSKLISISFSQKNNFYNYTDVKLQNIIVVGNFGEDISSNYTSNSFQIDFTRLKPVNSRIYIPEQIVFRDTTIISFQIHEPSDILLSIHDMFDVKQKTLLDKYMNLGVYDVYIDSYNENQEEFLEGRYKIRLTLNSVPKDSIYVVYEKNKN